MNNFYVIMNLSNGLWFRRGREEIFGTKDWADDLATILCKEEAQMYLNLLNDDKVLDKTIGFLAVKIEVDDPALREFIDEEYGTGNVSITTEVLFPDFTDTME